MDVIVPELANPNNGLFPNLTEIEVAAQFLSANSFPSSIQPRAEEGFPMPDDKRVLRKQRRLRESQDKKGFWLSLVNATPYRWKLVNELAEDVTFDYTEDFNEYVEPGQSMTLYAMTRRDTGRAEMTYALLGTLEPTSFTFAIHGNYPHQVKVYYGGALRSVGEYVYNAVLDLGVDRGTPCTTFFLAGTEDRFYANNAPVAWMQSMMKDIGNYTLRDIMLPRSHHSGMYSTTKRYNLGNEDNTHTQDYDIYDQLTVGGVRVIDFRPMVTQKGRVFENHGTLLAGLYHGVRGPTLDVMIGQINKFNDEYPGELIIIDVEGIGMLYEKSWKQLDTNGLHTLYNAFDRLKYRLELPENVDVTNLPLSDLIGDGKPGVIVRFDGEIVRDSHFPGPSNGFVKSNWFPVLKHWSNKGGANEMVEDQIAAMYKGRALGNKDALFAGDFIVTQKGWNVLTNYPIIALNEPVWVLLASTLWPALQGDLYPNWLAMDAIRYNELKAFAIAVNICFAAKKCGQFHGRIPNAKPFGRKVTDPNGSDGSFAVTTSGVNNNMDSTVQTISATQTTIMSTNTEQATNTKQTSSITTVVIVSSTPTVNGTAHYNFPKAALRGAEGKTKHAVSY